MARWLLFLLTLSFCIGCKGSQNVVGTWRGNIKVQRFAQRDASAEQRASAKSNLLILNADKTFIDQSGDYPVEGTYTFKDGLLTLTPVTMSGRPVAEIQQEIMKQAKGHKDEEEMMFYATTMVENYVYRMTPDGKRLNDMGGTNDMTFYYERVGK
jgi:hypothetical protein